MSGERVVIQSAFVNCPNCDGRDWHRYGGNYSSKGSQDCLRCCICGQLAETEWSQEEEPDARGSRGE